MSAEPTKISEFEKTYKFSVEIKQTAKGDPIVTIKSKSDESAKEAGDEALKEYKRIKEELAK